MENPKKGHFNDHLRERTISLSIKVYSLVQDKKLTGLVRPIVNQVIRSSSSVAANYRAAIRARSDNEVLLRILTATKKAMKDKLRL
jgi:four helix bundle protein